MPINLDDSLGRLRSRRLGTDRAPDEITLAKALTKSELYESRSSARATRYTLGAMQQVDPDFTRICKEEAERVSDQLKSGLAAVNRRASYPLQGSVPLNTHIRGASDVDQLVMHEGSLTYDSAGARARNGHYIPYHGSLLDDVTTLRGHCETILDARFPRATVDKSGRKAIRLSGGSLRREVDVVPAHWNDTVDYQRTYDDNYRAVCVLDKVARMTIENLPFLHIDRVHGRDQLHNGGIKMAIRLLKNIKVDTDNPIDLSSYELAGLMWAAPDGVLAYRRGFELAILHGTDAWLSRLAQSYQLATELRTPDDSRKIIDTPAKFSGVVRLSAEVSALAAEVAQEARPLLKWRDSVAPTRQRILEDFEIPC